MEWCMQPDKGLIKPDLVLYLDIDHDNVKSRSGFGEERYEKLEFQKKVGDMYSKFKKLYENEDHWKNVQADLKDKHSVHEDIVAIVKEYQRDVLDKTDLGRLEKALFA
jgi:dTMP kinase